MLTPNTSGPYAGTVTLCREHEDEATGPRINNADGKATCQVCGTRNYGVRVFRA